ncbi:hypothetical protein [Synechococcus sp. CBW1108]|uniref:hypothetical protein n=1 Tax=Synechococcus sp. CBW1108 TaxID=1353147 RepID=UPI0018CFD25A|nr:hypothetical protein [Synechococcus sp. CBW1108]QPN71148.1 hypothetical protein H8F27_06045 [Synechococcus sp. CBW1108]
MAKASQKRPVFLCNLLAENQFEFGASENRHFNSLAKYCVISALALVVFAIANASFLFNVIASGKVALMIKALDDALLTLAAFFAAYQLRQAAGNFRQIVQTQGDDLRLLNRSNSSLRLVFASLAVMLISLAIRFILDYPALMSWIKAA